MTGLETTIILIGLFASIAAVVLCCRGWTNLDHRGPDRRWDGRFHPMAYSMSGDSNEFC
ncbi:hypothetical protein [Methylobacterium iners]|nr:hypothetical protein [Methylobacterium iners]